MTTVTGTTDNMAAPTTATAKLTADFDMFLNLLTTQLQHQDPLDPMDSSQFTQQLVSYSQVEQAIQQTSRLDSLLKLTAAQDLNAATGLIGRELTFSQPVAPLDVDGAHWSYGLAAAAETMTLKVIDASGKVVRTLDGEKSAGVHDLAWDGKDDSGTTLPPGGYHLVVEAASSDGSAIASGVSARGVVKSVNYGDGEVALDLGGVIVRMSDVEKVAASTET